MRHEAEEIFERYLRENDFCYRCYVEVGIGNVDFCVIKNSYTVFCEVKAIECSLKPPWVGENIVKRLRDDLSEFRKKFKNKPQHPCILVVMNFSDSCYSAYPIIAAMKGDAGVKIDKQRGGLVGHFHHFPRGNASMTRSTNTSISGVLGFDVCGKDHYLFLNPYASKEVPEGYFPNIRDITFDKNRDIDVEIFEDLTSIVFWPRR